jgi:hypothetical protein
MVIMQQMVETECQRWASKGINIMYQIKECTKSKRTGQATKPALLKKGLSCNSGPKGKKKKKLNLVKMKRFGVGWRNPRFGLLLKHCE